MLLGFSRFVDASTVLKNKSTPPASNPASHASILLKNKDLASSYQLHASITRSFKYNPSRWSFVARNNITPPEAPLPSGSPSGSWRNWVVGIVLTFVLPFITRKWGPLILLKNKVDTVIESTEQVMEVIETVAKGADEIIDDITEDLPENSKLKKTMEAVDEMVEGVAKTAHIANEIIDKVEESEDKLESLILDHKSEEVSTQQSKDKLESLILDHTSEEEVSTQEPTAQN